MIINLLKSFVMSPNVSSRFSILDSAVYDPVAYERRVSCASSLCCSNCFLACDCCADKDEQSHIRALLFVNENDALVKSADIFSAGIMEEEKCMFEISDSEDDDADEEEEEEVVDEADALVLSNLVLLPEV